MVLVPGSLVLGLFYFFAVQYYLSKAAVSGGKKVQDAIAGDFRDGWKRYDSLRWSIYRLPITTTCGVNVKVIIIQHDPCDR